MPSARAAAALLLACLAQRASPAQAQAVGGRLFEDLDADGLADPGEAGIEGATVEVFGNGVADAGATGSDGGFSIGTTPGCRGVFIDLPPEPDPALGTTGGAWRRVEADSRTCPPAGSGTVGLRRHGLAEHLRDRLAEPQLLYVQLGDSIAAGVSYCFWIDSDYSDEVAAELDCLGPGSVLRDNRAVGGWESDDLLTPALASGAANEQFVPHVVDDQPGLVTISIGGNDFLATEGDFAAAMRELVDVRRNVQEILSTLVAGLPSSDIEINSVYDNQAASCATTAYHAEATPLWNQMLRHVAWGQLRPVVVAEVQPDFAHQDVVRGSCCGLEDQICAVDGIHPTESGAEIIQHALMESLGRVQVGAAATTAGFDVGALPLAAVLSPTAATAAGGPADESAALALDGVGATVTAGGEIVLSGFELPPGIVPVRMIAGVRYRTTGTFVDDAQLFDASVLDFAPSPGTYAGWDTLTPIVGGAGRAGAIGTNALVNAVPNVPAWRDVTAMVTLNVSDDGRMSGSYAWPAPTADDVRNLKIRLRVNAVGAPDAGQVEWDGAWLWVYGARSAAGTPPGEVSGPADDPLLVTKAAGPRLTWDAEPLAETYRVWRGDIGAWSSARAEPGVAGGCVPAPTVTWTEPSGPGSWHFRVSAVNAAGEGPVGRDSFGVQATTAAPSCP